jgi:DNA-3-methyladenine glycosylase I
VFNESGIFLQMAISLISHPDGVHRCSWCGQDEASTDYIQYHDNEWGMPVSDEKRLFEKICLEGFQSGLSWITVLRKRERFREVFVGFDFEKVARFTDKHIEKMVLDAGIIRHRGKIVSAINNAQRVCELIDEQGTGALAKLVWSFEPTVNERPKKLTPEVLISLTHTAQSTSLSKALKKRGFSFVGPTTMYAMMQSMGMVNDHMEGCGQRNVVEKARIAFKRPTTKG